MRQPTTTAETRERLLAAARRTVSQVDRLEAAGLELTERDRTDRAFAARLLASDG